MCMEVIRTIMPTLFSQALHLQYKKVVSELKMLLSLIVMLSHRFKI
jgi:hypothetical protein